MAGNKTKRINVVVTILDSPRLCVQAVEQLVRTRFDHLEDAFRSWRQSRGKPPLFDWDAQLDVLKKAIRQFKNKPRISSNTWYMTQVGQTGSSLFEPLIGLCCAEI